MAFNIDSAIFIVFLGINLALGLFYSAKIKNIKEYAVGDRNFSTPTIAATIIATWIFGSSFAYNLFETYNHGLYFVIPAIADAVSFFIIAYFFAPRMSEFLGKISVADVMGDLYGNNVRLITSISALAPIIGNVSIQFTVLSSIIHICFGVNSTYALMCTSFIIIVYSSFGGIKAVTFTDMIQFLTFGVVIPMTAFLVWQSLEDKNAISNIFANNESFDIQTFLSFKNPKFLDTIFLFLFFLIPGLDPALFQRLLMSKNTVQIGKACYIAGIFIALIYLTLDFTGLLLLANKAELMNQDNVISYVLQNYIPAWFKAFFIIGIMAMLMSTADSYINCSAVIFSHDFCGSIGLKLSEAKSLLMARVSAIFVGIAGLFVSLYATNLIDLILSTYSFYLPIVSVPLLSAIFGFRSTPKCVLIGMSAGFVSVILLKIYYPDLNSVILGMLANIVFLFGSHYLLKQDGGFVGIKDKLPLDAIILERKLRLENFIKRIRSFSFIRFCIQNSPRNEKIYVSFGFLCIISIFTSVYSLPKDLYQQKAHFINILHYAALIISTIFITYPSWSGNFKNKNLIAIFWNMSLFYCLVFSNNLLLIIGNFDQTLLTILLLNLTILSILLRWQVSLFITFAGIFSSIEFYQLFCQFGPSSTGMIFQFKTIYALLIFTSILIAFLKPKQEYQDFTEEKNINLSARIESKDKEIQEALAIRQEFIRNVKHEYHTPLTGIISMTEALILAYPRLGDIDRLKSLDVILESGRRLKNFDDNITTLARLNKPYYTLSKESFDFSMLLYERLMLCRRIYNENQDDLEFILDIEKEVILNCDRTYIIQLIDNLIINAITYCKKGKITLSLKKKSDMIEFSVKDSGIGIPNDELLEIFEPFTVSSKTKTQAGGRGVGLSVCKRISEVHGGSIKAESDGKKGASFRVELPSYKKQV